MADQRHHAIQIGICGARRISMCVTSLSPATFMSCRSSGASRLSPENCWADGRSAASRNSDRNLWGQADFDVRHIFIASYIYELPFFRGKSTLTGKLLGGWQISGITQFRSESVGPG